MSKSDIKKPNVKKSRFMDKAKTNFPDTDVMMDYREASAVSKYSSDICKTVDDMIELYPELELIMETITSLILTPNDMETESLFFELSITTLPSDIVNSYISVIEEHAVNEYGIVEKLSEIVTETLYTRGSYAELNLTQEYLEGIMDRGKKIASGTENSMYLKRGNINGTNSVNNTHTNVTVTNNLNKLIDIDVKKKFIRTGMEKKVYKHNDLSKVTIALEKALFNGKKNDNNEDILDFNNDVSKTIIKKLDTSTVVPITSKSDVKVHYGYFIILNEDGSNLNGSNISPNRLHGSGIDDAMDANKDILTQIRKKYQNENALIPKLKNLEGLRNTIIKEDIDKFITNEHGINTLDATYEIDDNLLLAISDKILDKSKLNVIYVPAEMVSYYAINFRPNGTGKSLLEKVTTLVSIRSILMFTNLLAYVKSSISTTNIKIDLDPDDANYKQNLRKIVTNVMNNRKIGLPVGMLDVNSFVDWAHSLGFAVEAKHPNLPDVNVEIEEKKNEINPVDTQLIEDIDKQIYRTLYVTPELLDETKGPELATTVKNNRALLNKRILKLQKGFNKLIVRDLTKKMLVDKKLISVIEGITLNNIKKIRKFLIKNDRNVNNAVLKSITDEALVTNVSKIVMKHVKVSLPTLQEVEEDRSTAMVENYTDMLDIILDKLFTTDFITNENAGILGDNIDNIKNAFKAILLRKFVDENNLLPDFTNMFMHDEDGKPNDTLLEEFNYFIENLGVLAIPFLKNNNKIKKELDEKIEKINNIEEEVVDDDDTLDTETDEDAVMEEEPNDNDLPEPDSENESDEDDLPEL